MTNEPQRTYAGKLHLSWLLVNGKTFLAPSCLTRDQRKPIFQEENVEEEGWRCDNLLPGGPELFPYTQVFLVQNEDSTSRLSPDQAKRI